VEVARLPAKRQELQVDVWRWCSAKCRSPEGLRSAARARNLDTGDGQQTTIFVSLANLEPDQCKLSIGGENAQTLSQIIPRTDVYRKSNFNQFSVGYREPFVAEADAPFMIFSQTERSMKQSAAPDAMSNGVVVWMVPAK